LTTQWIGGAGLTQPPDGIGDVGGEVLAELAGTVVTVDAEQGQEVIAGTSLAVIEAMKMEHLVLAPVTGVVTAVRTRSGETTAPGDLLMTILPSADPGAG